jgi:flagella basal body P-ring formation protein FlgA
MKQIITALLAALLGMWIAAAYASEVTLRTAVIVEGSYVTLGDLFENSGPNAARNIAYAPAPGRRATFDAKWLYRVANAYGLQWRPFSTTVHAVVERASQVVQRDEVQDALLTALRDRGVKNEVEIELANQHLNLHVAAEKASTVGVEGLIFDPASGRFVATVAVPANDPAATRTRVTGKVHKLVSVPVLAEEKKRGEVIRPTDIVWRDVRSSEIRDHVVTDDDNLIGMSAKRGIKAATLVHASQVRRPVMVPKGALVQIELARGPMSLSVQGKALEEGSKGDVIRVANIRSSRVIEAQVSGPNRVDVLIDRAAN